MSSKLNKKTALVLATWFGLGLSPKAPGTCGSLGAFPLLFLLAYCKRFCFISYLLLTASLLFFIGVWATKEITKNSSDKDPGKVVIDEVVGQLLTFFPLACFFVFSGKSFEFYWPFLFLGFLLFRFFDIKKLGLVKHFDEQGDAWGVMLDDVFAGLYAGIVLLIAYLVSVPWL